MIACRALFLCPGYHQSLHSFPTRRSSDPFSTLDDLAPGRAMCGLGVWWEPLASKVGVNRRKPLQAMRESVEVVRRLLAMEKVTRSEEHTSELQSRFDLVCRLPLEKKMAAD